MVSNQAPSSISINGWNQTLCLSHLLTAMVVSGFYHALYLSFSPQGCHVRWWRVFTAQGHPAKRVSGGSTPAHTLLNEPCMCPVWLRVSFTQRKEHIFLVYSKVQYGQPPLPCPMQSFFCSSVSLFSYHHESDPGRSEGSVSTKCLERVGSSWLLCEDLCLLSPVVLFLSLSMLQVASRNCSAVINTTD